MAGRNLDIEMELAQQIVGIINMSRKVSNTRPSDAIGALTSALAYVMHGTATDRATHDKFIDQVLPVFLKDALEKYRAVDAGADPASMGAVHIDTGMPKAQA